MATDNLIIGFSRSSGFKPFSWAIRLFEGSKYSHTYVKLYNRHFNDFDIYQASKGMVNHVVEENFLKENTMVAEFSIPIEPKAKLELINLIRYKLGKPYSTLTIIGIFLAKFGIKSRRFFKGEDSYICSELVARALKESGLLPVEVHLDVDKATPKQLYEICDLYFTRVK